jgi:hypothetical protein
MVFFCWWIDVGNCKHYLGFDGRVFSAPSEIMKFCHKCKTEKSLSEFHKDRSKRDGLNSRCKACNTIKQAEYLKVRKEKFGRTRARAYELKYYYGISEEDFLAMVKGQDGKCAICGHKPKTLYVDHCHVHNTIRGLLCVKCNGALGLFGDNAARVKSAALYLERHVPETAKQVIGKPKSVRVEVPEVKSLDNLPEIKHTYKCECDLCKEVGGTYTA